MALKYADRVKETTTTTGTGTLTLAGAVTGFQSFAAIGDGHSCVYCIDSGGSEWEVGVGTYTSSGTTLSRTTVIASSNSGSLVSFSAGSKEVYVTKSAQNLGNMSDDGMVVVHETVFAGMSTATYSNGNTPTLSDGIQYGVSIANGAGVQIDANGLKANYPTSGEMSFYVNSNTLLADRLGKSRLRRGGWAIWCHLANWSFASTSWAYVIAIGGNNYSAHCWGTRKTRNTQGGANTANGSLGTWQTWNGSDVSNVFAGAPDTTGNGSTNHSGAEDVVCMYFHDPFRCSWYYGTYSGGWPSFESLKYGAYGNMIGNQVTVYNKIRDPATTWNLAFCGGSGGNSNSNYMTMARWRLTYWDP